jgi:hypothetical protein
VKDKKEERIDIFVKIFAIKRERKEMKNKFKARVDGNRKFSFFYFTSSSACKFIGRDKRRRRE